jgi:hypothetical protein
MADDVPTSADVPASDAPSSSAVDTSTPPPPAASDASTPSSGTDRNAPSSGDSRQSDREGLLAAVKKVVETRPETSALPSDQDTDAGTDAKDQASGDQAAATGPGDTPPDATEPAKPAPEEADPSEAELKKLRPETRRRFERLLAQRNEARQTIESLQPELTSHRQLRGYLHEHQLSAEDANLLLGIGAVLRRGDYQGFLNGVMPYVMAAQEAIGVRISPDLQQRVDEGLIDEATARELTRTRYTAQQTTAELRNATEAATLTRQMQHADSLRTAVDTWEQGIQRRDPDYAQMSGAVRRYAQGLLQERGLPRTPQDAVALSQAAYDEVKATFGRVRPAPKPTRASPSSIHVATGASRAEPRNMKDAVVMALENMRRAS